MMYILKSGLKTKIIIINGHTTQITYLNTTSSSLVGLINGHTTQISNLNVTAGTIFNN